MSEHCVNARIGKKKPQFKTIGASFRQQQAGAGHRRLRVRRREAVLRHLPRQEAAQGRQLDRLSRLHRTFRLGF